MSTRARRARSAVTRVTWARHFKGVSLREGRDRDRPDASDPRAPERDRASRSWAMPSTAAFIAACRPDLRAVMRLERPFLHSARLCFTHPTDGRRVEFDSPLPPDLESVIDEVAVTPGRAAG